MLTLSMVLLIVAALIMPRFVKYLIAGPIIGAIFGGMVWCVCAIFLEHARTLHIFCEFMLIATIITEVLIFLFD